MEKEAIYPSVSQKIHGQSCLLQRHFQDSRAISHGIMRNFHGMNWRGKAALLPESAASSATPMPITIGAPAEKRNFQSSLYYDLHLSVLTTILAPIQRVQHLLQNQKAILNSGRLSHPYNGILNCFSRTIRNEGFFSLWRGNGTRITSLIFSHTIVNLGLERYSTLKDQKDQLTEFFANCAVSLIVYPLLYAETRLANDVISNTGERQFNGVIDVWRKTYMTDGVRGLYRGWGISVIALLASTNIHKFVLPSIQPWSSISDQRNVFVVEVMERLFKGLFATMATYPMYTVRKRMMMSSGEREILKFKGTVDAISQIFKKEGVKSFYKGGGAEILRFNVGYWIAVGYYLYRRPAPLKKTGDEGGSPALGAVKLRWSNANDGSRSREK